MNEYLEKVKKGDFYDINEVKSYAEEKADYEIKRDEYKEEKKKAKEEYLKQQEAQQKKEEKKVYLTPGGSSSQLKQTEFTKQFQTSKKTTTTAGQEFNKIFKEKKPTFQTQKPEALKSGGSSSQLKQTDFTKQFQTSTTPGKEFNKIFKEKKSTLQTQKPKTLDRGGMTKITETPKFISNIKQDKILKPTGTSTQLKQTEFTKQFETPKFIGPKQDPILRMTKSEAEQEALKSFRENNPKEYKEYKEGKRELIRKDESIMTSSGGLKNIESFSLEPTKKEKKKQEKLETEKLKYLADWNKTEDLQAELNKDIQEFNNLPLDKQDEKLLKELNKRQENINVRREMNPYVTKIKEGYEFKSETEETKTPSLTFDYGETIGGKKPDWLGEKKTEFIEGFKGEKTFTGKEAQETFLSKVGRGTGFAYDVADVRLFGALPGGVDIKTPVKEGSYDVFGKKLGLTKKESEKVGETGVEIAQWLGAGKIFSGTAKALKIGEAIGRVGLRTRALANPLISKIPQGLRQTSSAVGSSLANRAGTTLGVGITVAEGKEIIDEFGEGYKEGGIKGAAVYGVSEIAETGAEIVAGNKVLKSIIPGIRKGYIKEGSTFIPETRVFGKGDMPKSSSIDESIEKFSKSKIVQTSSSGELVGTEAGIGRKGVFNLEDPGIYVTPEGEGSKTFLRIKNEGRFSGESIVESIKKPFGDFSAKPTVTTFETGGITRLPKAIKDQPGFTGVKGFFETRQTGKAFITKRSEIGQGTVKRQEFTITEDFKSPIKFNVKRNGELITIEKGKRVKKGDIITESGTKELEAIVPYKQKFEYKTPETEIGKIKGYDKYTIVDDVAVPIRETKLTQPKKSLREQLINKNINKNINKKIETNTGMSKKDFLEYSKAQTKTKTKTVGIISPSLISSQIIKSDSEFQTKDNVGSNISKSLQKVINKGSSSIKKGSSISRSSSIKKGSGVGVGKSKNNGGSDNKRSNNGGSDNKRSNNGGSDNKRSNNGGSDNKRSNNGGGNNGGGNNGGGNNGGGNNGGGNNGGSDDRSSSSSISPSFSNFDSSPSFSGFTFSYTSKGRSSKPKSFKSKKLSSSSFKTKKQFIKGVKINPIKNLSEIFKKKL